MSMPIQISLITIYRVMNRHQRSLQANVENWNEPKQIKPKSQDPVMSREIKVIYVICILYVYYVCVCVFIY